MLSYRSVIFFRNRFCAALKLLMLMLTSPKMKAMMIAPSTMATLATILSFLLCSSRLSPMMSITAW